MQTVFATRKDKKEKEAREAMHPDILLQIANERHRDRIKEAEHYRLVRQAQAGRPALATRLLEKLGSLLVKVGKRLQRENAPQPTRTLGWAE